MTSEIKARLEYLREQIEKESISYGEIAELEGLAPHIDVHDNQLLQWAGVPEHICSGVHNSVQDIIDCDDCTSDLDNM